MAKKTRLFREFHLMRGRGLSGPMSAPEGKNRLIHTAGNFYTLGGADLGFRILTAVELSNGTTLQLAFSAEVLGNTGFTLTADGQPVALSLPVNNGATIRFTTELVLSGQVLRLSYSPGDVTDSDLNPLEAFTDRVVTNASTVAAPVVVSATVDSSGDKLIVEFDQDVTGNGGFTLTASGVEKALSLPVNAANLITYTCEHILAGQPCLLDYTAGDIQESVGSVPLANFTDEPVTNNSEDVMPGAPVTARILPSGTTLEIAFSEPMQGNLGVTITADAESKTLSVPVNDVEKITWTCEQIYIGQTVLLTYTIPPGDIRDMTDNPAPEVADRPVTNQSTIEPPDIETAFEALALDSNGVMQLQTIGIGTPTFTRASSQYSLDADGVYKPFPINKAAFAGGRLLSNFALHSEDILQSAWSVTAQASKTDSETFHLTYSNQARLDQNISQIVGNLKGRSFRITVDIKADQNGRQHAVNLAEVGVLDYRNTVTLTDQYQRMSFVTGPCAGTGTGVIGLSFNWADNGVDVEVDISVRRIQVEEITGSDQAPQGYVKTDAATVSAVANFANANTVDGNGIVTEAKGADYPDDPYYDAQPQAQNLALYSNDLTNAAWAKAGCTATRDQDGIDGSANIGTRLTATGANATAIQTVTAASASHTARFWIKRITGSGTVSITVDGGSSWTPLTTLDTTYREFSLNATVANPGFGVRLATSGDEVAVGQGELYANSLAVISGTGPIFTAGAAVTRFGSSNAYDSGNHDDTLGAYYTELLVYGDVLVIDDFLQQVGANARAADGTNTVEQAATVADWHKVAVVYGEGSLTVVVDGVAATDVAYDGTLLQGALDVFEAASFTGNARNLARFSGPSYAGLRDAMISRTA